MKIWTEDEFIDVDPNDEGELEAAMLFKAEHIKAKADPELFAAVADMLSRLWDYATKRVDVVRCRECKYWGDEDGKLQDSDGVLFARCKIHNYLLDGRHTGWCPTENDFCSYGERKEGDDNG